MDKFKEIYERFLDNVVHVDIDTIHDIDREIIYEEVIRACYIYDTEGEIHAGEDEGGAAVVQSEEIPINYMVSKDHVRILRGVVDDDGFLTVYSTLIHRDDLIKILPINEANNED